MKTKVTYLGIIALCLAGCVDKSYQGVLNESAAEEQIPIRIIVGDSGDILEAKGSGIVDESATDVWEGKTINVLAFRRDLTSDYTNTSVSGHEDCIIDGSYDKEGFLGGKEATVSAEDNHLVWSGPQEAVYYQPGKNPYDFFAYYTDGAVDEVYRSRDDVRIIMNIDGSSDIMSAYAEITDEHLSQPNLSEIDKIDLTTYSFSSWSAKRNVHPKFYFRHHLTRFDFEMKAEWEDADNIIVDSIVIVSKKKGVLTVANKNPNLMGLDFSGSEYGRTALAEADGSPFKKDFWKLDYEQGDEQMNRIGGSLMVAPDVVYDAYIYLKQELNTGETRTHENHILLRSSEGRFTEGSQYLVSAKIYGLTNVVISVTLSNWKDGGNINVGSDRFEDE